jgi:hypothetical protein
VILAAGLLVLLGLGLFVAAVLTGITALYWVCVGVCVLAAVLLAIARKRLPSGPSGKQAAAEKRPGAGAPESVAAADKPGESDAVPASAEEAPARELGDPPAEDVEVTDLLLVVDLEDEVLVIDEHPRYHLAGCVHLKGRTPIPLPHDEARTDGFTPCGVCTPDRVLADRVRARKAAKGRP